MNQSELDAKQAAGLGLATKIWTFFGIFRASRDF